MTNVSRKNREWQRRNARLAAEAEAQKRISGSGTFAVIAPSKLSPFESAMTLRDALDHKQVIVLVSPFKTSDWLVSKNVTTEHIAIAVNKVVDAFKSCKMLTGTHPPITSKQIAFNQYGVRSIEMYGSHSFFVILSDGVTFDMDVIVAPDVRTAKTYNPKVGYNKKDWDLVASAAYKL